MGTYMKNCLIRTCSQALAINIFLPDTIPLNAIHGKGDILNFFRRKKIPYLKFMGG